MGISRALTQRDRDHTQIIIDLSIREDIIIELFALIGRQAVFFHSLLLSLNHAQDTLSVLLIFF